MTLAQVARQTFGINKVQVKSISGKKNLLLCFILEEWEFLAISYIYNNIIINISLLWINYSNSFATVISFYDLVIKKVASQ